MAETYPIGTRSECERLVKDWGFRHVFTWADGSNAYYPPHRHAGMTTHLIRQGSLTITYPEDNAALHNGEVKKETFGVGARVDVPANKLHEVWIGESGCEVDHLVDKPEIKPVSSAASKRTGNRKCTYRLFPLSLFASRYASRSALLITSHFSAFFLHCQHLPDTTIGGYSLVAPHVVALGKDEQEQAPHRQGDQHAVSDAVVRLVVVAVDLHRQHTPPQGSGSTTYIVSDDVGRLHHHIVDGAGDGARAHGASIARRHGDDDGMDVRRADEQDIKNPARPGAGAVGQHGQRDQQHETPDLGHHAQQQALVEPLRHPRPEQQVPNKDHIRGNGEQVRLKRGKPQRAQVKRNITGGRGVGDHPGQAEQVDGPHVVVAEGAPQHAERDGLAVVHTALAGVVAQHAVDHDLLLALVEPPVLAAEAALCLHRRRRHPERRHDRDHPRDQALVRKQVPPPACAVVAADVQEAEGEERADDGRALVGYPEVAQPDGQLLGFVPEGEEEDGVWDAAAVSMAVPSSARQA